jgi:hypothetical protein
MDHSSKKIDVEHIIRAAMSIAARRRETLLRLREALKQHNDSEAIKLAKELCGLDDQGCDRTDSRIH